MDICEKYKHKNSGNEIKWIVCDWSVRWWLWLTSEDYNIAMTTGRLQSDAHTNCVCVSFFVWTCTSFLLQHAIQRYRKKLWSFQGKCVCVCVCIPSFEYPLYRLKLWAFRNMHCLDSILCYSAAHWIKALKYGTHMHSAFINLKR